jgi:hypothetical protein
MVRKQFGLLLLLVCLSAVAGLAQAATSQTFGEYTVYYNAFTTNSLQPAVAEQYKIVRSKNRGMLTVSVIKSNLSPVGKPVRAKIKAAASNLTGQLRSLDLREVNDAGSIYYVSEFNIAHEEVYDFTLEILPEGTSQAQTVKFRQQFFTD